MNETPLSKHGFDVMNELPPLEEFKEKLKARNVNKKIENNNKNYYC